MVGPRTGLGVLGRKKEERKKKAEEDCICQELNQPSLSIL